MTNGIGHNTQKLTSMMQDCVQHLRDDIGKVDDPRAQALFETSAEAIEGLINAFNDYNARNEPGWQADPT